MSLATASQCLKAWYMVHVDNARQVGKGHNHGAPVRGRYDFSLVSHLLHLARKLLRPILDRISSLSRCGMLSMSHTPSSAVWASTRRAYCSDGRALSKAEPGRDKVLERSVLD